MVKHQENNKSDILDSYKAEGEYITSKHKVFR